MQNRKAIFALIAIAMGLMMILFTNAGALRPVLPEKSIKLTSEPDPQALVEPTIKERLPSSLEGTRVGETTNHNEN